MRFYNFFGRNRQKAATMVNGRPTSRPGRSGIAIVAIMRDERRHIEDWLRFHSIAGVENFFLYDDGSIDGTPGVAEEFFGANVRVFPWKMSSYFKAPDIYFSRQVLAYCHAIENFGGAFRWMAFIDIDEYIVPQKHKTILDALDGVSHYTNLSLPWTMFGPSGHIEPPSVPAPYAFTQRASRREGPLLKFKCIVDPADVVEVRVHKFRTESMGDRSCNDVGVVLENKKRVNKDFISSEVIQLNHYYTRSKSEIAKKLSSAVSGATPAMRARAIREKINLMEAGMVLDRSAEGFLSRAGVKDHEAFRSYARK